MLVMEHAECRAETHPIAWIAEGGLQYLRADQSTDVADVTASHRSQSHRHVPDRTT
jgi:hypothetical protein